MRRLAWLALLILPAAPANAQEEAAVSRAVESLRRQARGLRPGEAALAGFALLKAEVPPDDPAIAAILRAVEGRFSGSTYRPDHAGPGGASIYEAAVTGMFYAQLDPQAHRGRLETIVRYLLQNQMSNGGWDYGHRMGSPLGDASISQYGVLGLWECANAGVRVPARAWDAAAGWYVSRQNGDGSWSYHPDERTPPTISMTAAGVGSLLICKLQLERHRATSAESPSPLLTPVASDPDAPQGYRARTTTAAINAGINRGLDWLAARWQIGQDPRMGLTVYYGLYGIERIGALSGRAEIGRADWYAEGRQFLISAQQADGSWNAQFGAGPNTAWGVLFLTRSTEKTVRRLRVARLGAGTLIGGRGLPEDLTSLTIAGGHVLVRPMNGAVEEMLAVLEDPRALQATEALSGLVARYHVEGPPVLRPHAARFRKLLADPDPGIRSAAAWALGRTGDLDVAPDLIAALEDPEAAVVAQARDGLRLLARTIDGHGPEPGATAEEKRAAARRWRAWYESVRPREFAAPVDRP